MLYDSTTTIMSTTGMDEDDDEHVIEMIRLGFSPKSFLLLVSNYQLLSRIVETIPDPRALAFALHCVALQGFWRSLELPRASGTPILRLLVYFQVAEQMDLVYAAFVAWTSTASGHSFQPYIQAICFYSCSSTSTLLSL